MRLAKCHASLVAQRALSLSLINRSSILKTSEAPYQHPFNAAPCGLRPARPLDRQGSFMPIDVTPLHPILAATAALRRALSQVRDPNTIDDLLFLERWEM